MKLNIPLRRLLIISSQIILLVLVIISHELNWIVAETIFRPLLLLDMIPLVLGLWDERVKNESYGIPKIPKRFSIFCIIGLILSGAGASLEAAQKGEETFLFDFSVILECVAALCYGISLFPTERLRYNYGSFLLSVIEGCLGSAMLTIILSEELRRNIFDAVILWLYVISGGFPTIATRKTYVQDYEGTHLICGKCHSCAVFGTWCLIVSFILRLFLRYVSFDTAIAFYLYLILHWIGM